MKSSKEVLSELSASGMRITEPTKLICELIYDQKECWHPRAEEIIRMLAKKKKRVSQATVYNVLNKLYKTKNLQEITLEHGMHYFDTNLSVHYHLYCPRTGKLQDVHCDSIKLTGVDKLSAEKNIKKIDVIIHIK